MTIANVMLIDDEEHIIEYVTELIESIGFKVIGFAHGAREALEKLQRLDPDIILLDVTMPGIPGSELVAEIKKRKQHVKVIMLTSRNTVHIVKTCIKNGAEGYILKNQGDEYIRQKLFDVCGVNQNLESCEPQ
ncbi:response regulator transcription factor [Zooshikella harenae]|uniref:Response regulator n=1 Tax=Zooshikella harenae TaxID=2827238 RepID=A0ABS5ZKP2_9GAMM|nr:response regulator [Zooshikella harenae]MBU2713592.1 response regulator [Zooshikella harenae]